MKHVIKTAPAAVVAVALATGVALILISPAQAARGDGDERHCVTHREYAQIRKGQRKARLHRKIETRGWFVVGGAGGGQTRMYESCWARPKKGQLHGHPNMVFLTYDVKRSGGPHWVVGKTIEVPSW